MAGTETAEPETAHEDKTEDGGTRQVAPESVLEVVRELVHELEPAGNRDRDRGERVGLDSALGSELGLDSLSRAELLGRLEKRFDVTLPDRMLGEAESPRDLLRAVSRAVSQSVSQAGEGASSREPSGEEPSGEPTGRDLASEEAETGEIRKPEEAATLLEVLDRHAERNPDRRHILYLERGPGEGEEEELTYGELRERSRAAAAALQGLGLERGQSVGLMLPSGLDYFVAFVGTLRAGGVPVPLYPPMRKSQIEDHLERQAAILDNARVRILVTFDEVRALARLVQARVSTLEQVVIPDALRGDPDELRAPTVRGEDTAFLQYTSGSTGLPKGVILTHANLLANLRSMGRVVDLGPDEVVVSWLPLYHDMGLIGAWMGSLYFGMPLVLMSPLAFLSRPMRWLRAIHRYRGTISAAPNFAYELCLKKIADDELEDLDLSSWRIALNGAEPVSPRSVERFPERFAPWGFREEAMMPVYGLAENSLAVAFTPPERKPWTDTVDREELQRNRRAVQVEDAGETDAGGEDEARRPQRFVSCGRPIPDHEVRIVGPDGEELEERREGRVQFRGPSATSGYFRNPEETSKLFHDGWLDSGDLGYVADGEIFLTGRSKDVIIRAGRNIYPQEVEDAVGDLDGVRKGCVAVFASLDEEAGTERLVVMAETRLQDDEEHQAERYELRRRIQGTAMDLVGTDPDEVVLVPPRTVPKTSSGKIRRSAARERYEQGELDAPRRAVWWQVVRLALAGVGPLLRSYGRRVRARAYAVWFWGLFGLLALPVWPVTWALPKRAWRRRFIRRMARLMARLTGTGLRLEGLEHLEGSDPRVITSNHASYVDGFVLAAVLPPNGAYLVKGELRENAFARIFLERIGCVFVERFDPRRGEEASSEAVAALERGDHLVIFPEGTFDGRSRLLAFRMGAFVVAARTGTPVVPVVLRGTRGKLPPGRWRPRRGDLAITVCPPVRPKGDTWSDAVDLRDAVREVIARRLPGA